MQFSSRFFTVNMGKSRFFFFFFTLLVGLIDMEMTGSGMWIDSCEI